MGYPNQTNRGLPHNDKADMTTTRRFVITCQGVHVREATAAEAAVYLSQSGHPSFFRAVRISETEYVDEDTGPGIWFGGAGF